MVVSLRLGHHLDHGLLATHRLELHHIGVVGLAHRDGSWGRALHSGGAGLVPIMLSILILIDMHTQNLVIATRLSLAMYIVCVRIYI